MKQRLIDMLAALDDESLRVLDERILGATESQPRASLWLNLELELKSPKHIRDVVYNLQPPAFRILELLLDSPEFSVPLHGLREQVMNDTAVLSRRVTEGAIVDRGRDTDLYRRVMLEAWRSEVELDASEISLLLILRRELRIRQVEHFLLEHHRDFDQFWNADHAFLDAMNGLRSRGLVFVINGHLHLPEDLVGLIRQILGLEMTTAARQRLLGRLSGQDTAEILSKADLKSAGSKDEKLQRLLDNYLPPSEAMACLGIAELKELCRELDLSTSGAKEELVYRIVKHFENDRDLSKDESPPPPPPEPRVMTPEAFQQLFSSLRQQDLSDILAGIESPRVTGAKEHLVRLVQDSRFSEATLLTMLNMKQLEYALDRARLRLTGTKSDRVQRLIKAFVDGEVVNQSGPAEVERARS